MQRLKLVDLTETRDASLISTVRAFIDFKRGRLVALNYTVFKLRTLYF